MLRNEWMSKRNDLLKFLVENKIPLRQAIEMLEQAEPIIRRKIQGGHDEDMVQDRKQS
jgi:hypothetical protein